NKLPPEGELTAPGAGALSGFTSAPATPVNYALRSLVQGEAQPRCYIDVNGRINWGAGASSAADVALHRVTAGMAQVLGVETAFATCTVTSGSPVVSFGSTTGTLPRRAGGGGRAQGTP